MQKSRKVQDDQKSSNSAYVGRSQRHMSASAVQKPNNTRTYYPEQYFNRVGYSQGKQGHLMADNMSSRSGVSRGSRRVDALGQRVRERFNEELEYPAEQKKAGGTLKARNLPKGTGESEVLSRKSSEIQSRVSSAIVSRRQAIARDANNRSVKGDERPADQESIITKDNLKQFNVLQGTIAGTANEELEA